MSYYVIDRYDAHPDSNLRVGILVVVSFFLVISVLTFPNGKKCSLYS